MKESFEYSVFKVLENSNSISIMVYLGANDRCKKSELYSALSSSAMMPRKLDALQDAGLIEQFPDRRSTATMLQLTEKGRRVSALLSEVGDILADGE